MRILLLYLRTVRHLRPAQVFARLWLKAYHPRPDLRPAPPLRAPSAAWRAAPPKAPRLLSLDRARFLNVESDIGATSIWNDPSREKLWLYNLHYFDDLARDDRDAWRDRHLALMRRWVAENPPGMGNGWEPYPLSLRLANWIKWHLETACLDDDLRHSLAVQARYLRRRLEHHLLANHLLANIKALALAGMFFYGDEARAWRQHGMKLLSEQLTEQVLSDGGHFELSPMYHSIVLEDALDLINAAAAYSNALGPTEEAVIERWRDAVPRMLYWLAVMSHPDGGIGYFNDAALGMSATLGALREYASTLGLAEPPAPRDGVTALAQSGYVRLDSGPAVLLADVGRVGPDYNPGHAHADTLSFEFSLFGQRVMVNSGTSRYGLGPDREAERATAAHSTVQVDGENSTEVWAGFRVARRASPFDLAVSRHDAQLRISCAHDGYRRLAGRPVHRRAWMLNPGALHVEDRVEGAFGSAVARFHLHPVVKIEVGSSKGSGILHLPAARKVNWRVMGGGAARVERSFYCPEFGRRVPSECLAVEFTEGMAVRLELTW